MSIGPSSRGRFTGVSRVLVVVMLVVVCRVVSARGELLWPAAHAAADGSEWEHVGLAGRQIIELSAPGSGALFAQTQDALWRSDDAGVSWRLVPLPAGIALTPIIRVDLHDHTTIYVEMAVTVNRDIRTRIMRTRDEGASWQQILPSAESADDSKGLVGADAQSGLLYSRQEEGRLRRSEDGGDTWVDLSLPALPRPATTVGCVDFSWYFPHPTNPDVIYRVGACRVNSASDADAQLPYHTDVSHDRGNTWATLSPSPFVSVFGGLVGCGANFPSRLYVHDRMPDTHDRLSGAPAYLIRSDDGGQTWQQIRGGEEGAAERIDRVACHPTNADRVFLLRSEGRVPGVRASQDGGRTWGVTSLPDGVTARDLVVGVDGRYLFIGTDSGVWRLRLANGQPQP